APSSFLLYLDALRLSWNRYVINWSLRDQVGVALTVRGRLTGLGPALQEAVRTRAPVLGGGLMLLGALAAGALAWHGGRTRRGPVALSPPAFYRRALRLVGRRGLRPRVGETAREFEHRVAYLGPTEAEAFAEVRRLYERTRFGGAPLGPGDQRQVEAHLA